MTFLRPKMINKIKQALALSFLGLSITITLSVLIFILSYILINGLYTNKDKEQSFVSLDAPSIIWEQGEYTLWVNRAIKLDNLSYLDLQKIFTESTRNWGYLSEQNFPMVPLLLVSPEQPQDLWLDYLSPKEERKFQSRFRTLTSYPELLEKLTENKGTLGIVRNNLLTQDQQMALEENSEFKRLSFKDFALVANAKDWISTSEIHLNKEQIEKLKRNPTLSGGVPLTMDQLSHEVLKESFKPNPLEADAIRHVQTQQQALQTTEGLISIVDYRWAIANDMIPLVWKEYYRTFSLTWDYFTSPPFEGSRFGGISFIIMNTLFMIAGTSLVAIPLGVSSALYLTHYSRKRSPLSNLIRSAFDVLSSLPAIIFGLFGMTVFVPVFGLGLVSGCLSTMLMILPNITKASEEAIKSVSKELYHASLALGATKFTSLFRVVIPSAATGIITGIILAIGRAFSEAAVLLFTLGTSLTQIDNLHTSGRVLTVHLYLILQEGGLSKAFPVAVVIVITVLFLNIIADTIRNRLGRKLKN